MNLPAKFETNDGQLFKLVTRQKHVGFHHENHRHVTIDGVDQVERACPHCGLVRITVMQGEGRREYRHFNGCQFMADVEPECVVTIDATEKGAA